VPQILPGSNSEVNSLIIGSDHGIVKNRAPCVQTNFDLSQVDIREIMVSDKLIEKVSLAAKKMGVELQLFLKSGENCVIMKCKETD